MFGPIDVGCRVEIDQLGLSEHGRTPTISWVFADGRRLRVDPLNAEKESAHFAARPALCEYVPVGPPRNASGEVALLMVANSPTYLFRLWLLFLNKLLFATDAGLRPFLWVGELPAAACAVTRAGRGDAATRRGGFVSPVPHGRGRGVDAKSVLQADGLRSPRGDAAATSWIVQTPRGRGGPACELGCHLGRGPPSDKPRVPRVARGLVQA